VRADFTGGGREDGALREKRKRLGCVHLIWNGTKLFDLMGME
jgi:hypothetical protein